MRLHYDLRHQTYIWKLSKSLLATYAVDENRHILLCWTAVFLAIIKLLTFCH
ncbi:unnamed protein product [Periconia digitata]|uniref:Uncharacterized protein n=1 Tax=Periconia digitata TaxID=1303443 RepID=A0A9W4UAK9_9PLEO|nr:unnamed protein product [Periconia digitata]